MRHAAEVRFRDRASAGAALAELLTAWRGRGALVLGIPRGGVPVAAEVAERLGAELDVVVAHKLGAPGNEELAIGAVTANGGAWRNERYIRELEVPEAWLARETERQRAATRERERRLRSTLEAKPVEGRVVIVVDDGVATGATMIAALRSVRMRAPERLVVAVPVASVTAVEALRPETDEVLCLGTPEPFYAVGCYYDVFDQVPDAEVQRLLLEADRARGAR